MRRLRARASSRWFAARDRRATPARRRRVGARPSCWRRAAAPAAVHRLRASRATLARRRGAGLAARRSTGACAYVGAEWALPEALRRHDRARALRVALAAPGGRSRPAPRGLTFVLLLANECVLGSALALPRGRASALRARAVGRGDRLVGGAARATARCALRAARARCRRRAASRAGIVQADISHYDALRGASSAPTMRCARSSTPTSRSRAEALARGRARSAGLAGDGLPDDVRRAEERGRAPPFDRAIAAVRRAAPACRSSSAPTTSRTAPSSTPPSSSQPSADGRLAFDTYRKATLFPAHRARAGVARRRHGCAAGCRGSARGSRAPAPRVVPLRLADGRTLRVAPLICYDAVDPRSRSTAARAGAELIVTLSNDSWFAAGGGPRLHLVVSAFRSIETRRPQVRATNTGISAVDRRRPASCSARLAVDERGALAGSVIPARRRVDADARAGATGSAARRRSPDACCCCSCCGALSTDSTDGTDQAGLIRAIRGLSLRGTVPSVRAFFYCRPAHVRGTRAPITSAQSGST